jgi:hypothetical protein
MNKKELKQELKLLLTKARKDSWETMQMRMLDGFEKDVLRWLKLFNDDECVGHKEELIRMWQTFQGRWAYEHNCGNMSSVF